MLSSLTINYSLIVLNSIGFISIALLGIIFSRSMPPCIEFFIPGFIEVQEGIITMFLVVLLEGLVHEEI